MYESERAVKELYKSVSRAKLVIESEMDTLIKEGLTEKASAPLLEIMEITASLLRGKL